MSRVRSEISFCMEGWKNCSIGMMQIYYIYHFPSCYCVELCRMMHIRAKSHGYLGINIRSDHVSLKNLDLVINSRNITRNPLLPTASFKNYIRDYNVLSEHNWPTFVTHMKDLLCMWTISRLTILMCAFHN